jgi:hypothetical protein
VTGQYPRDERHAVEVQAVPPVVERDVERPGFADGQGVEDPRSGGAGEVLGLGYAGRERRRAVRAGYRQGGVLARPGAAWRHRPDGPQQQRTTAAALGSGDDGSIGTPGRRRIRWVRRPAAGLDADDTARRRSSATRGDDQPARLGELRPGADNGEEGASGEGGAGSEWVEATSARAAMVVLRWLGNGSARPGLVCARAVEWIRPANVGKDDRRDRQKRISRFFINTDFRSWSTNSWEA